MSEKVSANRLEGMFDYYVSNQDDFNEMFNKISDGNYEIKDGYITIFWKAGTYSIETMLTYYSDASSSITIDANDMASKLEDTNVAIDWGAITGSFPTVTSIGGSTATPFEETQTATQDQTDFIMINNPQYQTMLLVTVNGNVQTKDNYVLNGQTVEFSEGLDDGDLVGFKGWVTAYVNVPGDDTVSTIKIQNDAVTTAKIDDDAVTDSKIDASILALNDTPGNYTDAAEKLLAVNGAGNAVEFVINALIPIGTILPWHKDLTGVPSLPSNFVECNGQTLSDAGSPLNGEVIPNLNGDAGGADLNDTVNDNLGKTGDVFLKGDTTSGKTELDRLQTFEGEVETVTSANALGLSGSGIFNPKNAVTAYSTTGSGVGTTKTVEITSASLTADGVRNGADTKPRSFSVVYIMRVK